MAALVDARSKLARREGSHEGQPDQCRQEQETATDVHRSKEGRVRTDEEVLGCQEEGGKTLMSGTS